MKKLGKLLLSAALLVTVLAGCSSKSTAPTRGAWDKNTYTSTYAKLTFNMPDKWIAATDEEIAEQMDITAAELSKESKYSEAALKKSALFDMMAINSETNSNIIVMYENLKVSNSTKISIDEYITALKSQLISTGAPYSSSAINTGADKTIGGETYKTIDIKLGTVGTQYYFLRKTGNYIACIIVTLDSSESIDDVMANFA